MTDEQTKKDEQEPEPPTGLPEPNHVAIPKALLLETIVYLKKQPMVEVEGLVSRLSVQGVAIALIGT